MPWGPNSLAKLWDSALKAHLPVAKDEKFTDPFTEAVAPVKMRVGGCSGEDWRCARRRGRTEEEKLKAPRLEEKNIYIRIG